VAQKPNIEAVEAAGRHEMLIERILSSEPEEWGTNHPLNMLYYIRTENGECEDAVFWEPDLAEEAAAVNRDIKRLHEQLSDALRLRDKKLWRVWDGYLSAETRMEDLRNEAMYRQGVRDGIRLALALKGGEI